MVLGILFVYGMMKDEEFDEDGEGFYGGISMGFCLSLLCGGAWVFIKL